MEQYEAFDSAKKKAKVNLSPEKEFKSIALESSSTNKAQSFLPSIGKPRAILPNIEDSQNSSSKSRSVSPRLRSVSPRLLSVSPSINELRKVSTSPDLFRTISPSIEKQHYLPPNINERRSDWNKFLTKKNKGVKKYKK